MIVSIVIVEYFCLDTMGEAVESIFEYASTLSCEVIVVSNSVYPLDKQKEIQTTYSEIEFIFNQDNVGFGKAVNQGIRKSSGEFVMLLNPDGKFIDNSLENAIEFMRENPQVAVIGPKIIESTGQLQDSCREFMTFGIMAGRMMKRIFAKNQGGVLENKDYSSPHQVDWVSGACMLARKDAINKTGMLDERYFMYVEDMDWCRSFKKSGWQVWYIPDWTVEHNAGRASSGRLRLLNRLMWIHFVSFCRYKIKWALQKD